ncbi:DNA-3-methyladenine glycosylase family protein, partial [Klebsiella pneumoniae]|uniref:DNA-3-methyladenine glycosylase family protein n=1 Tax=Klebsiella pneumoniae TaxID=573 RepID=UPI0038552D13
GKVATLRALSAAVVDGRLSFDRLDAAPEDDVREALTSVRGIGPWTADIYLMFCRGDVDAFAPGDLALQVGVQRLFGLEARPSPVELAEIA